MPVRHDRSFWEDACREVRHGAKIVDVARRLRVRPRTLQWWCWKLRGEAVVKSAEFLPVLVSESASLASTAAVELETKGVRIRVELGTDVQYVAALVAALRSTC